MVKVSNLLTSLLGVLLIVVARGLLLRLQAAWRAALTIGCVAIPASLIKELNWEDALPVLATVALLLVFRPLFTKQSTQTAFRIDAPWAVSVAGLVMGLAWIGSDDVTAP